MSEVMKNKSDTTTALALVETLVPAKLYAPGNVRSMLDKIKAEVRAEVGKDQYCSTSPKGRTARKSLARKVASSKVAMDDAGKTVMEDAKRTVDAVNTDRRIVREELDALRDEIRKPVDDYEAMEAARVKRHEDALAAIYEHPEWGSQESSADIEARIDYLNSKPWHNYDWQEFSQKAADTQASELARASKFLAAALKREADAAELARLQAEADEHRRQEEVRARREREDEIARQAAERAKREAEDRAAAAAKAEADRVAAEQRAVEQARLEAMRQQQIAEERARLAELRERQAQEQAERDRLAAIEAERKRAADQVAREKADADKRAKDKAHRAPINGDALADLVAAGMPDVAARVAIIAIAKGGVRHVSISY